MTLRVVSLLVRLDTLYLADGARGIANLPAKYDELIRCEACKQCLMNCRVKKSLEEASSKITERMEEGLFDTNCKATPTGTFLPDIDEGRATEGRPWELQPSHEVARTLLEFLDR